MAKTLLHFKGVYGDQHQPFKDTDVYIEPIIQRSKRYNYEINEHLHSSLVQVFILERGAGKLLTEGRQIDLETPCAIVIPQGILHGFSWTEDIGGNVITISVPLFESCLEQSFSTFFAFEHLQYLTYDEDGDRFQSLIQVIDLIQKESAAKHREKQVIIELLVKVFLLQIFQKNHETQDRLVTGDHRSWKYYNAFIRAIAMDASYTKSIKEYALDLNITPVHLNRVCQSIVRKSALKVVHEKQIIEAKKHLLYTSQTIAEIAYELSFKDPSHFSKFFRRMVGVGPKKFRQSQDVY